MPRIVETTVFTIDELSDAAKENARIWYRDQGLPDEWYDFVYEDFETICGILGVTLATSPVRLYGGGTRDKSQVNFSGFWNQGDGASFAGHYSHAKGAAKAIRAHAPQDTELHRIADELQALQRKNFWQVHASIRQLSQRPDIERRFRPPRHARHKRRPVPFSASITAETVHLSLL